MFPMTRQAADASTPTQSQPFKWRAFQILPSQRANAFSTQQNQTMMNSKAITEAVNSDMARCKRFADYFAHVAGQTSGGAEKPDTLIE